MLCTACHEHEPLCFCLSQPISEKLPSCPQQVQKVRQALRECGLGSVRVGTVDDFQGQEARIVFISTVLSRLESLPALPVNNSSADKGQGVRGGGDLQQVGFWRNPKRFNVAITRARALLVVIGHPIVLMEVSLNGAKSHDWGWLGRSHASECASGTHASPLLAEAPAHSWTDSASELGRIMQA